MAGEGLSIQEALEKCGYKPAGTCTCDGYNTIKYKMGLYEFRWRKNRYLFRVLNSRRPLTDWQSVANVEKYLNELHVETISKEA